MMYRHHAVQNSVLHSTERSVLAPQHSREANQAKVSQHLGLASFCYVRIEGQPGCQRRMLLYNAQLLNCLTALVGVSALLQQCHCAVPVHVLKLVFTEAVTAAAI